MTLYSAVSPSRFLLLMIRLRRRWNDQVVEKDSHKGDQACLRCKADTRTVLSKRLWQARIKYHIGDTLIPIDE